jgi:Ca2+-binding RTX toxin-like protein
LSEIKDRITMLSTNVTDYSQAIQDWFNAVTLTNGLSVTDLVMQAAYDNVEADTDALDDWLAELDMAAVDTAALAVDKTEQIALNGKFVADLEPELRDWFVGYQSVLDRINAKSQDLYSQALIDGIDFTANIADVLTALNNWFVDIDFKVFAANVPAIQAKWERANPRYAGVVGSIESILSKAVLIGGTGRDTISIYDNARAEAVLAQVDVFSAKPYQPDDPSVATPAQIAADPMQQRIDFTRISFVARDGGAGPDGSVALNSFEMSTIYLGAANDKVEVKAALQPINIFTGGGNDDIFIGSTPDDALSSNLDGIDTTIRVDGGMGSTRMVVSRGGDTDGTGTVSIGEGEVIIYHFAGDDKSLPPLVTAVQYQTLIDPTFNPAAAGYIAGSYKSDEANGFDRGVAVYTGDGDDKSVQIKSIRKEAPMRVYLGKGDDIASVLPSLNGDNYGLQFLADPSLSPHDKLEVFGNDDNDRIDLSKALVNVHAYGGAGDDRLIGSTGFDILIGGAGNDWIEGYGAELINDPNGHSLWGQQVEVLIGDFLGRLFEVEGSNGNLVRYQLPGYIDVNSQAFDDRWMERGGVYLFDRMDDAGQFMDLNLALDGDGILKAEYRGGNPLAEWNSLASPTGLLGEGGDDLIFSGVALPSGLGMSMLADAATRNGTNIIFGGAGQDRIFAGNADDSHAFGHVIVGDEARLRLRDDNGGRMFQLRDIAAARPPQNNPRGDDWILFGAGNAQVLSGRGNDAIFGGLNADGTNAVGQYDVNIVSSMGEIKFVEGITDLNFMKSLEDQPDGDDTVMIGDDDVSWIGGGGNDRIWVGYETDLTQTATFQLWKYNGDQFVSGTLREVMGQNPAAYSLESILTEKRAYDVLSTDVYGQDYSSAYLLDGTNKGVLATLPDSWTWKPTVSVIDTSSATRRVQTMTLLSDYAQIERMVYNDAAGDNLPDGYENTATSTDLFEADEVVIVEVAKSVPPAVDFDKVLADLSPALGIELRGWNRGDAGHDTIIVGSARGQIIAGEGNDIINSGDNNVSTGASADASSDLIVMGDAGQVHRIAETDSRYTTAGVTDFPRLIRVSTSAELTPVRPQDLNGDNESQAYRGGNDIINLGVGNHVVVGGLGADDIDVATTYASASGLHQIVSGDGATMLFDPRLDLSDTLSLLYYETMERNSALLSTSISSNDDTINVGGGDVLVTGGVGKDVMTLGEGRQFVAGDYASFTTVQYDATPDYSTTGGQQMIFMDQREAVYGADDTITSAANQVVFIGGAGDDTAVLQNGMTEDEVGNVFAMGGRGQFVFDLDMTGTSGFAGDDTRTVPNMFNVLTLGNASTFDYELAPEFSTDGAVPVLVTVNDRVNDPINGKGYLYIANLPTDVSDWAAVDFSDITLWKEVSATDIENVAGGNDTIHMSYGRIAALGGGGADVLTALGSDNSGNENSRDTAIFAGDSAKVVLTPDDEKLLVQLFETLVDSNGRTHFTGLPGSTGYASDRIELGSGHMLAIGGEGDDSIENGDGRAIVLGDNGRMEFAVSYDHKINTVSNAPAAIESEVYARLAGNDSVTLGEGTVQIVMGGGRNDTVLTQVDANGDPVADLAQNASYFAGDRATLVFDPTVAGFQMMSFSSEDDGVSAAGDDSFTTGDGDVRAILGYGNDTLTKGDGLAAILGDAGTITATPSPLDPSVYVLRQMAYRADALAVRDGMDTVTSGDGNHYMIMGGMGDTVTTGDGEVIALGDWGIIDFDADHTLRTVSNTPNAGMETVVADNSGDDSFQLGEGVRHVVMGGAGNDTVLAQVDVNGDPIANLAQNDSYFAGDHAELVFAAATAGQYLTQMRTFRSSDWADLAGDDSFTTGDGDVRAILGIGSDTLVQGNGLGYVIGDLGSLDQDNAAFILSRIESMPDAITLTSASKDSWTAGDGEHVGIMGADDDTVVLGDGPVQVLLDHSYILRDATNGKLIHTEDETTTGWGNDSLVAGSGWGFVIGGGGNDTIATGRTANGDVAAVDGRHVILGDAGYIDANSALAGDMELTRVEAYMPAIFGDDTISGGAGRDIVIGGAGSDAVHGEAGRDFVAGDYLLMDFDAAGLIRESITQRDLYFLGEGDLVTTGYDGDFVFGGTQFNTMGVAASVDVIFETFGRILFEQGRDIEKIERLFNLGVASSLLDERVKDGQVPTSGAQTEDGTNPVIGSTSTGGLTGQEDISNQNIDSIFADGGAAPTGTSGGSTDTFLSDAGSTGGANPTLASVEPVKAPAKAPTEIASVKVVKDGHEAVVVKARAAAAAPVSAENIQFVQNSLESDEDMLTLLETGAMAMSVAPVYRHYGKARSVGSLEQRLREWTASGFALRGGDNGNDTHA